MTTIFTPPTVTDYNLNAPSDDGSNQPSNRINWSKHKEKIGDPLKTALESTITNVTTAMGKLLDGATVISTGDNYTATASDQGRTIKMTSSGKTLTTPDATVVGTPFLFAFVNAGTGFNTLDGSGTQEINGKRSLLIPPGAGGIVKSDGTNWTTVGTEPDPPLPRGYLWGLQLTRDSGDTDHDISIAVGEARSVGHEFNFRISSAHIKRIDATWASGTGNGGLASAVSLSNATWYHVFLVDDGNGNTEAGFDTSVTATNLLSDTGGSYYRRIGSILTDGSANITAFQQVGSRFLWSTPVFDYDAADDDAIVTVSTPLGIRVLGLFNLTVIKASSLASAYLPTIDLQTETAPNLSASPGATLHFAIGGTSANQVQISAQADVLTNTTSQIKVHSDSGTTTVRVTTLGWVDSRGQESLEIG